MNFDELKRSWKERNDKLAGENVDQLVDRLRTRSSWFETTIARRDLREHAAAVFVLLFFGVSFFSLPTVMAQIGCGIIMAGSLLIMSTLIWSRRGKPLMHQLSVIDFTKEQLLRVDRQIWLLRNVTWWYTGPLMLGIFVFVLGIAPPTGFVAAYLAGCVLFGWFVHWLNQQAVKKQLMPYREELLNTLEQLEFNPNLDQGTEE